MTDLASLQSVQAAAFAAWKAAPAKPAARKSELSAALDAATKAVVAAKKAAATPEPAINLDAALDSCKEKEAAKAADKDLRKRVWSAVVAYNKAQEWPRCGQNWGSHPGEAEAEMLIKANIKLAQQMAEEV